MTLSLMMIALLLLSALVSIGVLVGAVCPRLRRSQFSVRTLMIGVTLVAIGLSAVMSWRYINQAGIEWLEPSSAAARQLWAEPVVTQEGDEFTAVYRSKCRDEDELYSTELTGRMVSGGGSFGMQMDRMRQLIKLESSDKSHLKNRLAALAKADVPKKGWFSIRGAVEDREGRPVADAMVNLRGGSWAYINHFKTREDGTFTMPIQAPPDRGYYFDIRYGGNRRMKTAPFTLSDDNRELVVRIRVK